MPKTQDLKALGNMITEAKIATSPELPQGRSARALENLTGALVRSGHLVTVQPAAILGAKGRSATAKRDSDGWTAQERLRWLRTSRAEGTRTGIRIKRK